MYKEECIPIGRFRKTNGVEGDLVASFSIDDPYLLEDIEWVHLEISPGELIPFAVENLNIRAKENILISLEFIDSVEKAGPLAGLTIFIAKSDMPETAEDEFYFHEIIGWKVLDNALGEIGLIKEIIENPGQDLMRVESDKGDIFIPLHDDLILEINKQEKFFLLILPEGLIELNQK